MEKFTVHTGTALPLRRSNVDTDQIIPAVYLKRVTRHGFEDGLFAAWRTDPDFVLNQPQYAGATVLVAGPDFGTGSSREHAVWALRTTVSGSSSQLALRGHLPRQRGKSGLLTAVVDQAVVEQLWALVEADPASRSDRRPRVARRSRAGDLMRRSRSTTTRAGACSRASTTSASPCSHADAIAAFEADADRRSLPPRRPAEPHGLPRRGALARSLVVLSGRRRRKSLRHNDNRHSTVIVFVACGGLALRPWFGQGPDAGRPEGKQ